MKGNNMRICNGVWLINVEIEHT